MSGLPIDPDTRILTRKGWKSYQDYIDGLLIIGEDIYTYEPSSRTFKWEPLVSVILHGNGPLASINLQNTVINNDAISLIMGEKVPWVVEVVKRDSRRLTGYDSIKLKEIDNSRMGIGELKRSHDIGTTYYLILGEVDNLITHQENDNRVDLTHVTVTGGGGGMTWTAYNTNETVVVQQKGLVFCVGTLSLRDGLGKYVIPLGNIDGLPIALNGYILVEKKAVQLKAFSGFSPLIGTQIISVVIETIPPDTEGILYRNNIPISNLDLPLTLTLGEANELIYIPNKLFIGISTIGYKVIDSLGGVSGNVGNLNITVINNESSELASELTLGEVKDLLIDLPNQVLNSNINNFPTDYSTELTLEEVKDLLIDLPNQVLNSNVNNFPTDYSTELTLQSVNTKLDTLINYLSQTITTEWLSITVDTAIPAGSSYMYIYIKTGTALINGIEKVTGEYINFEPSPFARHSEMIITVTPGSIVEVIRGY